MLRRAILQAEAAHLESFQAIKREEFSLQLKTKDVELSMEIVKAEAKELVYAEAEASYISNPVSSQIGYRKSAVPEMSNTDDTS